MQPRKSPRRLGAAAGLIMMTQSWAQELGIHNVRVNAIAPGLIKTDLSAYFWKDEEHAKGIEANQPLPRVGEPEEIGSLVAYLCSPDAAFVTGTAIPCDGGFLGAPVFGLDG